jgi:uncharacterized membrane protein
MSLNFERLGIVSNSHYTQSIDPNAQVPAAIKGAQKGFLAIQTMLLPLCRRVNGLNGLANQLANLHTAFKSIKGREIGLRLSLFAVIVFPMTLVTGMLAMADDFGPGKRRFWVYWAVVAPLVFVLSVLLMWRHPWVFLENNFRRIEMWDRYLKVPATKKPGPEKQA